MQVHTDRINMGGTDLDAKLIGWRREQLLAVGFPPALAYEQASDPRVDLHELTELVERGCPPDLAVRILAPLEERGER